MSPYECIICGSREHVLREGKVCLCTRCLSALGEALESKLPAQNRLLPQGEGGICGANDG